MKVSELTIDHLKDYLRTDDNTNLLEMLAAAKAFIKSYTGLNDEEVDEHEDLVFVVYVLVSDMYDNRSFAVNNNKINPFAEMTLGLYSKNLL